MDTIGNKIYNLRKEKGVSQEELGFALSVSRQTVSRWETDTVKPTVENLESLTKFFGVNSDYFLSEPNAESGAAEQLSVAKEVKKPAVKIWKTLIAVAVMTLLAIGVTACGIATYVAVLPVQGQEIITANRFNGIGIICLSVGLFLLAILIALLILCLKNRAKN